MSDFDSDYKLRYQFGLATTDPRAHYRPTALDTARPRYWWEPRRDVYYDLKTGREIPGEIVSRQMAAYARYMGDLYDPLANARAAWRTYTRSGLVVGTYGGIWSIRLEPAEPWSGAWWRNLGREILREARAAWREATRPDPAEALRRNNESLVGSLTLGELERRVQALEPGTLADLRLGPVAEGCGICRALRADHNALSDRLAFEEEYENNDALYAWHGEDAGCDEGRYLRCILFYTLAGWDPAPGWEERPFDSPSGGRPRLRDYLGGL